LTITEYGAGESVEMPVLGFDTTELVDATTCSISHENTDRCYDATGPCSSIDALKAAAKKDTKFTGAISDEKCTY
tara:strand:- start:549 stop:773 length:225 start_codon:yes stop_codon:yes gene_type:complete